MTEGRMRRRISRRATSPAGPPAWREDREQRGVPWTLPVTGPPRTGQTDGVLDTARGEAAPTADIREADADGRARPALDLLIWDAPNIDMTLSTVIGARPTAASRPRFDAIAAWFVDAAGDPGAPDAPEVEACVFANIPPVVGSLQR